MLVAISILLGVETDPNEIVYEAHHHFWGNLNTMCKWTVASKESSMRL